MTDQERLKQAKLHWNYRCGEVSETVKWLIEQAEIKLQHESIVKALVGEETLHQQGLLEPEVSRLTKENHALKCELGRLKTKAKNSERARRRKDNYINRMNNHINTLEKVMKKRNKQLDLARDTLDFYADNENYKTTNHELLGECLPEIIYDDGANARQTLEELK